MIKITKIENNNVIYYTCECGVIGKCLIRPLSDENVYNQIVYIQCPACMCGTSVLLYQDKDKECYEENVEYSCGIVIENEILEQ